MSVEIQGLEHLIARLSDTSKLVTQMKEAANFVEGVAKEKAPKKTGRLIGSIENKVEVTPSQITATVFTPVEYSQYQEFGTGLFATDGNGRKGGWAYEDPNTGETVFTRGNRPHPFLGPALRENKDVILEFLQGGLIND